MSYREPREPSEMPEFYDPEYYKGKANLKAQQADWLVDEQVDEALWLAMEQQAQEGGY